jgi:hypothetical protein
MLAAVNFAAELFLRHIQNRIYFTVLQFASKADKNKVGENKT